MRALLLAVAVTLLAVPALASDEQDCFQGKDPQQRIKGCSELIRRDPKDASAYHNRAVAYSSAGDVDSAIADYSRVIEIAPNTASAYENRGRAYASKGDHTRAVADQIKASELMARAKANPTAMSPEPSKKRKATAVVGKATAPKVRADPKAINNGGQQSAASSWWPWLWGSGTEQSGGKNIKP